MGTLSRCVFHRSQQILLYASDYTLSSQAVLHEKFGDGIMSMIDCNITVDKKKTEKGDRVVLTFECVVLFYVLYP